MRATIRYATRSERVRGARTSLAKLRIGLSSLVLGLMAFGVPACGDDPTGPEMLLDFTVQRFNPIQGSLPSDAAVGGVGAITITGGIQTPCLAQPEDLKAEALREGVALALRIRLEPEQGGCIPGVDSFSYEARIENLESGTYHLTVSQRFLDDAGYVTLDTDVTVN